MKAVNIVKNDESAGNTSQRTKRNPGSKIARLLLGTLLLSQAPGSNFAIGESPNQKLAMAKTEIGGNGITKEQRNAYKPIISEAIYHGIDPETYDLEYKIKYFLPNLMRGRSYSWDERREDAWLLYLGMPQKSNTFSISDYRPQKMAERDYYFKITDFWETFFASRLTYDEKGKKDIAGCIADITQKHPRHEQDDVALIMGKYTLDSGKDQKGSYISYYDQWDLAFPLEEKGLVGKPLGIYDRLYYDPITFKPIGFNQGLFEEKAAHMKETLEKDRMDLPPYCADCAENAADGKTPNN
jgi:hypothetical protein